MSDWFEVAKAVNYGTDDVPDKYGFTERCMTSGIWSKPKSRLKTADLT